MKKIVLLLAMSCLVIGCGLVEPTPYEKMNAYYGPHPDNYQEIIKSYMRYQLFDPNSAMYEFPAPPQRAWMNHVGAIHYGWAVGCLINAKNRLGGYVGFQEHIFLIRDGKIILTGNHRGGLK